MHTKKIITSAIICSLLFTSCASKSSSEGGEGTKIGSTLLGSLVGVSAVYLRNTIKGVETTKKEVVSGAVVGGLAGFIVGNELSKMQKKYKSKEKRLISDILKIDKESAELANKNSKLTSQLNTIKRKISQLQQDRNLKQNAKANQKSSLRAKLRANRQKLRTLIGTNRQISKKISRSQSKAQKYNYNSQDRKNILLDINKLSNNSKQYDKKLNAQLLSINRMIRDLA